MRPHDQRKMPSRPEAITQAANRLIALLKFSPNDESGRFELMRLLDKLAATSPSEASEQLEWLVDTVNNNFNEWPGPMEIRAAFCTKYRPRDGIEAYPSAGPLASKIAQRAVEAHDDLKHLTAGGTLKLLSEARKRKGKPDEDD